VRRSPNISLLSRKNDKSSPSREYGIYSCRLAVRHRLVWSWRVLCSPLNCTSHMRSLQSSSVHCINYSNTTKNNILFIDVLASRRKPSSGLTSDAGRQYVKSCPIRGSTRSSPRLSSVCYLWSPYGIGHTIIFSSCRLFFLLCSSPNLSRRRLDVCHTSSHGVALVQI